MHYTAVQSNWGISCCIHETITCLNQGNTSRLYDLYSRVFMNSLANQSSMSFRGWRYQNNPRFGGVQHLCFVHFLFMQWARFHPTMLSCITFRTSTSLHIHQRYQHSLMPTSPAKSLSRNPWCYLWQSPMIRCKRHGPKSGQYNASILWWEWWLSWVKGQRLLSCLKPFRIISFLILSAMEIWCQRSHSKHCSDFTAAIASHYLAWCDLNSPLWSLHSSWLVTQQSWQKAALPTRDSTLLQQFNTVDSGAWLGQCGQWQIKMEAISWNGFTILCSWAMNQKFHITRDLRGHFGMLCNLWGRRNDFLLNNRWTLFTMACDWNHNICELSSRLCMIVVFALTSLQHRVLWRAKGMIMWN